MTRLERGACVGGGIGLAASALGWMLDAPHFYAGWLAALVFVSGWPLGSMAIVMIHALTGGRWGEVLRPALRTGVCALPLLLPAALPLAMGLAPLYPWARPGAHLANAFYLNTGFFAGRGVLYLLVWFTLGWLVLRGRDLGRVAPAGLFLLAITVSFAAIDTTMSLDPHFTSSIYGMIAGTGMGLLALSAAVLLTAPGAAAPVRGDLGKLLLALVILWIYLDFMQLLIVWQSDLASESPWYLARSRGYWGAVRVCVALGHFVLPFLLLVSPRWQRSPRVIVSAAALLVAMEALRSWWIVLPALDLDVGWIDIACLAALGGLALAAGLAGSRRVAGELRRV